MTVVEGHVEAGIETRHDEASALVARHGDARHVPEMRERRDDEGIEHRTLGHVDQRVLAFLAKADEHVWPRRSTPRNARRREPSGTRRKGSISAAMPRCANAS